MHPQTATHEIGSVRGSRTPVVHSLGSFVSGSGAVLEVRLFEQGTFALRLVPVPNAAIATARSSAGGSRSGRPAGNSTTNRRPDPRSPGSDDAMISAPPD